MEHRESSRCIRVARGSWLIIAMLALAACSSGTSDVTVTATNSVTQFSVGGTVSGLTGTGLVLENNGTDVVTLAANGTFSFPTPLVPGDTYDITVLTQPTNPAQTCSVINGSGTITNGGITNVSLTCVVKTTTTDTIGGTAQGVLGSGLVLEDNGGDPLTVTANGAFTFATPLAPGAAYSVSVLSPPINPYQNCAITNGAGTTGGTDVTGVIVTCKTNPNPAYSIGGTVTGVTGSGGTLVLQDNGRDNLTITADGPFTFPMAIPSGSTYSVTVLNASTQQSQTCAFANASGTVMNAAVTNVSVACKANATVTATVSGLVGTGLVLQDNGADNLSVSANGLQTFATAIPTGSAYSVTVATQPVNPSQTCVVANGSGTAAAGVKTPVTVACTINSFAVNASVSGLNGSGLVLLDNGGNALNIPANGTFTFTTPVASGAAYAVTVAPGAQPTNLSQTCTPGANAAGTIGNGAVTVAVTCVTNTYPVSVTVRGLAGTGLVLLDNGGSPLSITGNGTFAFNTPVASGGAYAVTVAPGAQPVNLSQTCTPAAPSAGTLTNAGVNVVVNCVTNTYPVSVTVRGLAGTGLVLLDNGGNPLAITANGTFAFTTPITSGGAYAVTVAPGDQPTNVSQTCTPAAPSAGTVTNAAVNVVVNCVTNTYPVNVTVQGLAGTGLVLLDNGGNPLAIAASGTFAFTNPIASGAAYAVTVAPGDQPTNVSQTCTPAAPSAGTVTNAGVTVVVNCVTNTYPVSVTVQGLAGTGLVLLDNGGNPLSITANGTVAFTTPIASGAAYAVTVAPGDQPTNLSQTCTPAAPSAGTVTNAGVTVVVNCVTNTYTLGGTITGLLLDPQTQALPTGMTLQDNGTTLPINTAGITGGPVPFSFGAVPSGSAYNVTVIVEPSPNSDGFDYLCAVANGVGTVTNANVGNIAVTCSLIGGYLYVTNGGGGNISGFAIDINSGALEPLTGVVAPIGQPNAVVTTTGGTPSASVSGCYQNALYIANSTTGKVSTYTVSSDTSVANPGALTLVGTPLGAGTTPEFLDFDYDDCAAFALNAGSSNVSSYSTVIATGALTAINTVGTGANSVPAASANTYVEGETTSFEVEYVASQVTNTLTAYSFSATGGLTLIPTDPAAGLPNPVATGVKPSAVAATTINVGVPGTTTDIETPFVYVANQTDDTITMYSGNATNYNAPIGLPKAFGTVNTGRGPTSLAVIGNLLYVANGLDNTVEAYSIDTSTTATTGTLTRLNLTFPTGTDPVFLQYAYVDYAPYLYVVNALSNDLYVYAVTTEGTEAQPLGTLTLVGKYAVGTAPTSVAAPYTYNPD